MQTLINADSFIKPFEGEATQCRHIDDIFVLFRRDGTVVSARSFDTRLKAGDNIYAFMPEAESKCVADLCLSFDYNRLLVDTELGAAVIYTDMGGTCGLLAAVIPLAPKAAVVEHFSRLGSGTLFVSDGVGAVLGSERVLSEDVGRVRDVFQKADEIFLTVNIAVTKYRSESDVIRDFGEYILRSADYIGCVGSVKSISERLPKLENFNAEMYAAMTACSILFARNWGKSRGFKAKIGEYKSHPVISFYIDVDEGFNILVNECYKHSELEFCAMLAGMRETFFECYYRDGDAPHVLVAYIPETDPLDGRIIKESIERRVEEFWHE